MNESKHTTDESSPPKTGKSSSLRVSPLLKKTSCHNIMEPLPPLTITEPSFTLPESTSMDLYRSNGSCRDTYEKQNSMDIKARMQRERTRLLESYNTLNNITRIREDQVHFLLHMRLYNHCFTECFV